MKIFIAYTSSELDMQIALKIALSLKDAGHNVVVGDSDDLRPTIGWEILSFGSEFVRNNLRRSDALIAICVNEQWREKNVGGEIAFFLGQSSPNRLVVVKNDETVLPDYMNSPFVVTYQEPLDRILSSLEHNLRLIQKELRKQNSCVFLSYSRQDEDSAQHIYKQLRKDGYRVWFDRANLYPGQDWKLEITKAIHNSIAFIILLSSQSVGTRGYFQRELKQSLDVAEEIPEGKIFILPVKLDACEVPEALKKYQWCDFQGGKGYEQLSRALEVLFAEEVE